MNGSYAYLFAKAVLTLIFVLGLLGLALYALKAYVGRNSKGKPGRLQAPVRVLNTTLLGQKKNLAIVEVAGEVILLGITPTSVNFISKITDSAAVEELKKNSGPGRGLLNIFGGGL